MNSKNNGDTKAKRRILISGGGTAGHIWPLIAISQKIKDDFDILYIGSGNQEEREMVEKYGIKYKKVFSGKWRRYFSWKNFIDPLKVLFGIFQSLFIILFFRPNLVFTKGGYVTVPVGIAAFLLRKKIIIHESDAVMGLSNIILSRFAKKVLVSFPKEYYSQKIQRKAVWTGVPVRNEVLTGDVGKALDDFDFDKNIPIVLFIGGSSGASSINKLVMEGLDQLLDFCQVIHVTGRNDYEIVREKSLTLDNSKRKRFRYFDFVHRELADIFAASNLVVSRSGATTLTELAALKKPVIFIPYPYAASNHQYVNAQILEKNQAAIVFPEGEIDSNQLISQVKRLLDKEGALENLSNNIQKFYKKDSCDLIIKEINELLGDGKNLFD